MYFSGCQLTRDDNFKYYHKNVCLVVLDYT